MAHLAVQGRLKPGDQFVSESYIGSRFIGRVEESVTLDGEPAIIPSIEGTAWSTGLNTVWVDRADPLWAGFSVI
jgi:4-hydroxyproline epimerase